jgi:pimeloyl-ACP methyl ester carboxylesterase
MLSFDGLDLNVVIYGPEDAPVTVVLSHCWTVNQEVWRYQVRALLKEFGHRIRIVAWDHRGHGLSDPAPRDACTVANLGTDMGEVIDNFAPTGKLILAGHSIGGMTIMALAEQRPDIFERTAGVLFTNTSSGELNTVTLGFPEVGPIVRAAIPWVLDFRSLTLTKRARRRMPFFERVIMSGLVFGDLPRITDVGLSVGALINTPRHSVVGFYKDLMHHHRFKALQVLDGIPTIVVVGTKDRLTPPRMATKIVARIEGAKLIKAPQGGHMLPLERDELISGLLIRLTRPCLNAELKAVPNTTSVSGSA